MSSRISQITAAAAIIPTPASPYLLTISGTTGNVGLAADVVKMIFALDFETTNINSKQFGLSLAISLGRRKLISNLRQNLDIDASSEACIKFGTGMISSSGRNSIGQQGNKSNNTTTRSSWLVDNPGWNFGPTPQQMWDRSQNQ